MLSSRRSCCFFVNTFKTSWNPPCSRDVWCFFSRPSSQHLNSACPLHAVVLPLSWVSVFFVFSETVVYFVNTPKTARRELQNTMLDYAGVNLPFETCLNVQTSRVVRPQEMLSFVSCFARLFFVSFFYVSDDEMTPTSYSREKRHPTKQYDDVSPQLARYVLCFGFVSNLCRSVFSVLKRWRAVCSNSP